MDRRNFLKGITAVIVLVTVPVSLKSFPLDGLPAPTYAAGRRRLHRNYHGPFMQLRRGNIVRDIYENDDPWLSRSDVFLVTLYDQSGNENHRKLI